MMNRTFMNNLNRLMLTVFGTVGLILCMLSIQVLLNPPRNPEDVLKIDVKSVEITKQEGLIQQLTNKIACLTKGVLPSGGFCLENSKTFQGGNNVWDVKLCAGLENIFGHASVGDFGAGLGHYGSCFLRLGGSVIQTSNKEQANALKEDYKQQMTSAGIIDKPQVIKSWEGFDAAFNVEEVSDGKIHKKDLGLPFTLDHKYDWVMSLEVGEHIPRDMENAFIDNLVNHACSGIVVSWAVEGQGGYNHINTRNNDYIQKRMEEKGLKMDKEATKTLRTTVTVGWFKNTLMLFRFPQKKC